LVDYKLKEIFDKGLFRGVIKFDEPMAAHTSLRLGGPAEVMVFPEDLASLQNVLHAATGEKIPVFVFGAGTNLLVTDTGIEGVVISLRDFRDVGFTGETDGSSVVIHAGAGTPLAGILHFAQKNGCSGIEALAGIPGYLGGAVYMNAGSFGVEMKDVLVSVTVMNGSGEVSMLGRDKMDFSYRQSNLPEGPVILSADIALGRDKPEEIAGRMKEFLQRKKNTQPLGEPSAGCVFKNPEGDAAGRLIEAAGCKGMRTGDVEVSSVHANYFINKGRAKCADFIGLMEAVKERVREQSGIILEPEITIVGKK